MLSVFWGTFFLESPPMQACPSDKRQIDRQDHGGTQAINPGLLGAAGWQTGSFFFDGFVSAPIHPGRINIVVMHRPTSLRRLPGRLHSKAFASLGREPLTKPPGRSHPSARLFLTPDFFCGPGMIRTDLAVRSSRSPDPCVKEDERA